MEKLRLYFIFHSVSCPKGRTEIQSKMFYTDEICDRSTQYIKVASRYAIPVRSFLIILFIYQKWIGGREDLIRFLRSNLDRKHKPFFNASSQTTVDPLAPNDIHYEGRTESHEQLCFACELGRADEGECGGRWNQLLCYP